MIENKGDLISREYMKKAIAQYFVMKKYYHPHSKGRKTIPTEEVIDIIDNAPTVDLKDIYQEGHYDGQLEGYTKAINEERPQGEWIDLNDGEYKCPVCKSEFIYGLSIDKLIKYFPTCPNCGADLQKGGAE